MFRLSLTSKTALASLFFLAFSGNVHALLIYKCTSTSDGSVSYSFQRCTGESSGGLINVVDNSPEAHEILEQVKKSEPVHTAKSGKKAKGIGSRLGADAHQCENAKKQLDMESSREVPGDSSRQFEQALRVKNLKATYESVCGK